MKTGRRQELSANEMNMSVPSLNKTRIAIVTTCGEEWGGSEELWALSLPFLQARGCEVVVFKEKINRHHPRFAALARTGVGLQDLDTSSLGASARRMALKIWRRWRPGRSAQPLHTAFTKGIRRYRPQLVVVAQGINFDGLAYAHLCREEGVPYIVVCQKAVEFYWPPAGDRAYMRRALEEARRCFFVSQHNLTLTEEQFGLRLSNASIVFNPVRLAMKALPFPAVDKGFRLACIGRLFVIDKGQDLLLRILAMDKWRERPLSVSFVGKGVDEEGLRSMAALLGVNNIRFEGQLDDMSEVWGRCHALVLPSRSEGLPLVVLEAMSAGRAVIATVAGGTGEVVEDGVTGFLGEATLQSFEATLDRAWQERHRWEEMGRRAVAALARRVPSSPEEEFANAITDIL